MPWSGGVYTRGYASWTADANSSLSISASKFDTEDNDFASGLNNCLTIDGLNKPTSTLNWAVQMNWTRGSDGNIWSLARTGGANNPKLQASVTDAAGITLTASGGNLIVSSPTFSLSAAGDTTARGVALCKVKAATTSRNSTTTLANDPDLTASLTSGTYAIEAYFQVDGTTAGTGGFSVNLNYSGTFDTVGSSLWAVGNSNGGAFSLAPVVITGTITTSMFSGSPVLVAPSPNSWFLKGSLKATGSGTLAAAWAQNVSNANNTNLRQGSYLTITQVS